MILTHKRNELQIMFDLLNLAKENPTTKTRFIYQTNLSYTLFIKYLMFLVEHEFLLEQKKDTIKRVYTTTSKGKEFLKEFQDILDVLP